MKMYKNNYCRDNYKTFIADNWISTTEKKHQQFIREQTLQQKKCMCSIIFFFLNSWPICEVLTINVDPLSAQQWGYITLCVRHQHPTSPIRCCRLNTTWRLHSATYLTDKHRYSAGKYTRIEANLIVFREDHTSRVKTTFQWHIFDLVVHDMWVKSTDIPQTLWENTHIHKIKLN